MNTASQHTPGPWHYEVHVPQHSADAEYIVLGTNPDAGKRGACYSGKYFTVVRGLEDEADARLIAAAPDLLEALKQAAAALATITNNTGDGAIESFATKHFNKARAAINKAEGR